MTSRERVLAALEGRPPDRTPVTVIYATLYQQDHFGELTGLPAWKWGPWLTGSPEEYCRTFQEIHSKAPFEMVQPHGAPSRQERDNVEFVERDGRAWRRDKKGGSLAPMETVSGHAWDYQANETQYVSTKADADRLVRPWKAKDRLASGIHDYVSALSSQMGKESFILSGGSIGFMFTAQAYVGETTLLSMMMEQPELLEYLGAKLLEDKIEEIRALCAAGGDGIFIDETLGGSDMISPACYERFCLPLTREMIKETQRLGKKAIVVYFGGVSDRLDLISSLGADAVGVEASMKGYVNNIVHIAERIGGNVSLLGNLDPIGILERGTDTELEVELRRQSQARRHARGYIACTGSPITPATPLARVRRFLELGARY